MARVVESKKSASINPLKMSQPLGAAFAFMGLDSCMPLMHGSQGCTSFGLVLLVRHFKEAIPLQTSAMNEATTIMGGYDNLEKALLNIRSRNHPALIAICSTGLTETKGDDVQGYINLARQRHPELADTAIVYVSTPDYTGAFQDGWAKAVAELVGQLPLPQSPRREGHVAVLPGCHVTPGDIDELRDTIEAFGLTPTFVPDLSGSLDGHIPDQWLGTTLGGTPLAALRSLGGVVHALAIGEQMRPAAQALLDRCGVPFTLFDRLTGLTACDALVQQLSLISGRSVPQRLRRQRSQLVDTMLDAHFHFGHVRVALAAEPDLLWATGSLLVEMGATLAVAVTTTRSPVLERLPTDEVLIGDLDDWERGAAATGCDLLMTHSHGRQSAERLGKPLYRIGIPLFDRIGNAHITQVGYRGTRQLVNSLGNLLIAQQHHAADNDWPLPAAARVAVAKAGMAAAQATAHDHGHGLPATVHLSADIPRLRKPDDQLAPASA